MKRTRISLIAAFLMLVGLLTVSLLPWPEDAPPTRGPVPRPPAVRTAGGPVSAPPAGAPWAEWESDGFTPRTRALVRAFDAGVPLQLIVGSGEPRTFHLRPRRLLAEGFRASLGADGQGSLDAGLRVYEGLERQRGTGPKAARLAVAIAGGAVSGVVSAPDGAVIHLRTDEATGELRALERSAEEERVSCSFEPATGVATAASAASPMDEAAWRAAPPAVLAAVALPANGTDPQTGRLDKYVDPIAHGHNYELSLRDCLAIVTLDKSVTGAYTTARLTQITSEYIAKAANLAIIQEHNLGIRYMVQELILTPDDASFSEVPNSLGDYGSWISSRRPRGTYRWDLSTKFGNGAFSGGVIGLAWVRTLGSTSPVNVCAKGFGVALEAHEQGHNLGSDHSSGGIMNSSLVDSRSFFTDVAAGETSAKQIYDHASSRLTGSATMRHAEELPWAVDDAVDIAIGQTVELLPLLNDDTAVRNGRENTALTIEEVGRVHPIHAGTATVVAPDRVKFVPTPGYEGPAWFSYSLRGNVGNGGTGWLHKADTALEIGNWDEDSLSLELAPGQSFSFRPTSSSDVTIVSQPAMARVDTARDDRRLIIIRVLAGATGTDSFVIQRGGANSTVNLTYVTDFLQTRPDTFVLAPGQTTLRFAPAMNDQGAGYRNIASINPIVGLGDAATGAVYFPGAFRFISATLTTPAKGTLTSSTRAFTLNNTSTNVPTGQLTFTEQPNARGIASVNYTVEDAAGVRQSNTAYIILPLGEITSPATARAVISPGHGIILDSAPYTGAEPPLTGNVGVAWSLVRGPAGGSVAFTDAGAARTGATFSAEGEYVIRARFADGDFATTDEVTVVVEGPAAAPGPEVAGWWKMDEVNGTTALDSSGRARHGTLRNGTTRVAAALGGGLNFDGTDDHVDLKPHAASMQGLAQGTVAAWFKSDTGSLRTIFSVSKASATDRYARLYLETGVLKWKVLGDTGTTTSSLASPQTVNDNAWHHAAVTVDASQNARLYVDGELANEGPRPFFSAVFGLDAMHIGRTEKSGDDEYWRGQLDDVRVLDRPLSAAEVSALFRLRENRGPVISFATDELRTGGRSLATTTLGPTVTDDAQPTPPGTVAVAWSAAGPAGVTFANPAALATTFTAAGDGAAVLRLEAADGAVTTWREITAHFTGNNPGAPFSLGLGDVLVPGGAPPVELDLHAAFGDADGPDTALTFTLVGNTNPALLSATEFTGTAPRLLRLSFAAGTQGTSQLTVRATDGTGASVDASFAVTVADFPPSGTAQTLSVPENSAAGTVVGTILATDPEGGAVRFAIGGGNTLDAFAIDPVTGVLSVRTPFALDAETRPLIELEVLASEAANPLSFGRVRVLVNVTNVNEAPEFAGANFTLRTGSPAGTDVGLLAARDPEASGVTFALASGNTGNAFVLSPAGLLEVASPAALAISTNPRFTLTVTATDDGDPAAVTTATVRVTLEETLVQAGSALRWLVPASEPGTAWRSRTFNDAAWTAGTAGIGYDTGTDYDPLISTDVQAVMFNVTAALYVRLPFTVADASKVGTLTLRAKYEDGFGAWVNGAFAVSHGAPDTFDASSTATSSRDEDAAVTFRDDDVTPVRTSLVNGTNVVAVQVLNESASSSDLLFVPELVWSAGGTAAVPNPPSVETGNASAVTGTTATLGGSLTATGGAAPRLVFHWGRVDGGTTAAAWEASREVTGAGVVGAVNTALTGLAPGTRYWFRVFGENAGGGAWADASGTFETTAPPGISLVSASDEFRLLVPTDAAVDALWKAPGFADGAWRTGALGVGYDTDGTYNPHFAGGVNLQADMLGKSPSVYVRLPFHVDHVDQLSALRLVMKWEDGFIAFLNGHEIARRDAPVLAGDLPWSTTAPAARDEAAAVAYESVDVSAHVAHLVNGRNVLAVHGLNAGVDSSDFLLVTSLEADPAGPLRRPEVDVAAASEVGPFGATLRANVTSLGGAEAAGLTVFYGPSDGGADTGAWAFSEPAGAVGTGLASKPVTGLSPSTTYFYRFLAENAAGGDFGGRSGQFTTSAATGANFAAWIAGFPTIPPALRAPGADADGDGASNVLEYATGGSPAMPDAPGAQLSARLAGSMLELTWRRRLDRAQRGLVYTLQASVDGTAWTPLASAPVTVQATGDGVTELVTQHVPLSPGLRLVRLHVTAP